MWHQVVYNNTHCYGHELNLTVSDTIKQAKMCSDALDVAFEISKLVKFSQKCISAFDSQG